MSRARTSEPSSRPLQFAGAVSVCVWVCVVCVCVYVLLPRVASPLSFILARIGERSALRTSSSVLFGTRFPFCAARGDLAVAVAFLRGAPRPRALQAPFPSHTKAWKAAVQEAAWRRSSSSDVEARRSRKGMLPYMRAAEEV